ncbi:MAG: HEAT repeat domain-containing protein [Methylobacter sp.]
MITTVKQLLILGLGIWPALSIADKVTDLPNKNVYIENQSTGEIHVQVQNVGSRDILNEISRLTGVSFHYTHLPAHFINSSCASTSVKGIVACLFGNEVSVATSSANNGQTKTAHRYESDVWILNSSDTSTEPTRQELPVPAKNQIPTVDQMRKLVDLAAAVEKLHKTGRNIDEWRHNIQSALASDNPFIRAQAISMAAKQNSADADSILINALSDEESSVRLMAVSNVSNNIPLLEQALRDKDQSVRALAEQKLQDLSN